MLKEVARGRITNRQSGYRAFPPRLGFGEIAASGFPTLGAGRNERGQEGHNATFRKVSRLLLHSLRGFPVTDLAAHLPIRVTVMGRLRAEDVAGRYWYCRVEPPMECRLGEGVQRDHIHPDLLSEDRSTLRLQAVVLTPTASNRVLQPGVAGLTVHVAAVLDPRMGETGVLDTARTGYLGYAVVDDDEAADTDLSGDADPTETASVATSSD